MAAQFLVSHRCKLAGLVLAAFSVVSLAGGPDVQPEGNSWSGFYVGGALGFARGDVDLSTRLNNGWLVDGTGDDRLLSPFLSQKFQSNSFIGGVQAGYNYQIKRWVPGIVTDFDYINLNKKYNSGVVANPAIATGIYTVNTSYKTNWLFTLRPRLGYGFRWALPYITGGFAMANEKYAQSIVQQNAVFNEDCTFTKVGLGWAAGVGTDFALAAHWQLMTEYLYVHLYSVSKWSLGSVTSYSAKHSAQLDANIIRVGLNYVFS